MQTAVVNPYLAQKIALAAASRKEGKTKKKRMQECFTKLKGLEVLGLGDFFRV